MTLDQALHETMTIHQRNRLQGSIFEGRYELEESVGAGRMSSVYRARDVASGGSLVAVKVLDTQHPDRIKSELFRRETSALKLLRHQNVVSLLQSGWSDSAECFYLVLSYLPYSLDGYLNDDGPFKLGHLDHYRVMRELTQALSYAHSMGVVHRDIKPSNILLDENGRPSLTDFGMSKLLSDLTVGETLAGYWSGGYAAPEQRRSEPAGTWSDIYSLGAVFFHLLTGETPPADGPTPAMAEDHVSGPVQLKLVLKRMLAERPGERESSAARLHSSLETVTRQAETIPRHGLILTRRAVRDICDHGYIPTEDFSAAANVINANLGGPSHDEIHVQRAQGEQTVGLLGDSMRLICAPDRDNPRALAVLTVQFPIVPDLERDRERAMPYRAVWVPVESAGSVPSESNVSDLMGQFASYEQEATESREQRSSRREFIEHWYQVIRQREQRLVEAGLDYREVEKDEAGGLLKFALNELPPDNMNWDEGAPLAVTMPAQQPNRRSRSVSIGNLREVRGRVVYVDMPDARSRRITDDIPQRGRLGLDPRQILSDLRRQRSALNAFLNGEMVNPSLGNLIVEPSGVTRTPEPVLDYYQDHLSDDKKETVRKAVSSNELFLIQGPPGTGKTTVIAEIILQVLKRDPNARVLMSSQSNVAVDHVLARVGEAANAAGIAPPEMVRLGRVDKVADELWTVGGRSEVMREDIQAGCAVVLGELNTAERKARADAGMALADAGTEGGGYAGIASLVDDARAMMAELRECERQREMVEQGRGRGIMRSLVADALDDARQRVKDRLDELINLLSLPVEYDGENEDEVLEAIVRVSTAPRIADGNEGPGVSEVSRVQGIGQVVREWMVIAGRTNDFRRLIVEQSNVVGATCSFSGVRELEDTRFEWAIIDEAGRATVPEVLIPIVKAERAIIVGDERQLPPMVEGMMDRQIDNISGGHRLETSLFQSLVEQAEEAGHGHLSSLRTQYRMHPAIGNLIGDVFYEGRLENGVDGDARPDYGWMPAPVTWLSTSELPDRGETRQGSSYANRREAGAILERLRDFENMRRAAGWDRQLEVGIISGYQGQVEQLHRLISPDNGDHWQSLRIEIATVDAFQGRECDVVVYSTVRSNRDGRIGFLGDHRRINVALSRARDLLVIVGDDRMMHSASITGDYNPFERVIDHMRLHPEDCAIRRIENQG